MKSLLSLIYLLPSITCLIRLNKPTNKYSNKQFNTHLNAVEIDESWANSFQNGGITRSGVHLATFDYGLRGVVATKPTTNEPVVYVKSDIALEVTNNKPPTPFPLFAPEGISCIYFSYYILVYIFQYLIRILL